MKDNMIETAVGAVVILIAGLFFAFAYTTSGVGKAQGGYSVNAEFDNVEGINVGSDVRMAGIKIGTVTDSKLNTESWQAVLTFQIDPTVKLAEDVTAKITSEGLLGSKFVAIDAAGRDDLVSDQVKSRQQDGKCSVSAVCSASTTVRHLGAVLGTRFAGFLLAWRGCCAGRFRVSGQARACSGWEKGI